MRRGSQISLFGEMDGRGRLFQTQAIDQYLEDQRTTPIPGLERKLETIFDWLQSLNSSEATESTLEQNFAERILSGVLGYTIYPASTGGSASLYPKPSSRITGLGRTPDHILGLFVPTENRIDAVLELKTPGCDLDAPQPGFRGETPVEQAFYYGDRILGVRWVLVSDMQVIRLYSVESQAEYEEFNLVDCLPGDDGPRSALRILHFLLHHDYLIQNGADAPVARLLAKSAADQIRIRDSFYEVYTQIRADLFEAIEAATRDKETGDHLDKAKLLQATQRLLDRLLFIYYCEDHPEQLIPNNTVARVAAAAEALPGPRATRVFQAIKDLFREVDSGSAPTSGLRLAAYNGELFKHHPIIDEIELPDSLSRRVYVAPEPDGKLRRIAGVYGLHVYDFWSELNEHLLGHIFEESLSDLEVLTGTPEQRLGTRLAERKRMGVYYTSNLLSDFLASHALRSVLNDRAPRDGELDDGIVKGIETRKNALLNLKIADFACGSGAFLVSAYRELLLEFWRLRASLHALQDPRRTQPLDMFKEMEAVSQAQLLRTSLYGVDKLPQAVEIAKLALWLRSARKGETVADLSDNLVSSDSLQVGETFRRLGLSLGSLDIVLGNPPWGGEIAGSVRDEALQILHLDSNEDWDSWEIFLALGIQALCDGGRLALVLPDSFLYPNKARSRRLIFESGSLERIMVLGPDWFGPNVRMGSILIQFKKGQPSDLEFIQSTLVSGHLRRRAIMGEIPLTQVEAQRSREIPAIRSRQSEGFPIEVFRGTRDDQIMDTMALHSVALSDICDPARGEEINKAGLIWVCPSCGSPNTPGAKAKGGGYRDSTCAICGHALTQDSVDVMRLVREEAPTDHSVVPFIDGDDINRRYKNVSPAKWFLRDVSGWPYKDDSIYVEPKIVIRQAGVGLFLTLDETGAWCPQSVYLYRLKDEGFGLGYSHLFLLAVLSSRTMTYFLFKRFGEVDPDKAHAKVTHIRLADLPIPRLDISDPNIRAKVAGICERARKILDGVSNLGDQEDREIEIALRELWGLTPEDGAYINREFFDLPESQAIRDLFPYGRPNPIGGSVLTSTTPELLSNG